MQDEQLHTVGLRGREWFGQLVLYSNAITLCGPYAAFFDLGQGALTFHLLVYGSSISQSRSR